VNQLEMGQTLGRVEEGISSLHKKLDETVLPAQIRLEDRVAVIERAVLIAMGGGIVIGAGLFIARELLIGWLKQKLGIPV